MTSSSPIIRDLAPTDRTPWTALWNGYLDFYESHIGDDVTAITFARLLDPDSEMFALVAEKDGALQGFAHCVLHPGTWAIEDFCYLEDLFVAESARGVGLGRALIEAVYARADLLQCSRVYWLTHETNTQARALYDQVARHLGFIQYRR